ncbi:tetratricopeptide repeat protein 12-like [Anthonomus grandis grandis]|uniref:tetratricopeptide repeat protein 12-like n=1 Tax=Anthonomus grandis grandis TaxID=2921223 RepID=UPI0021666D55|nr:tetratricopeptide repeat protein 12-like [Anthonomus grandis grandis]
MEEKLALLEKVAELGNVDEEFNNFLHRVNEVDRIIKKLASKDKNVQKIGDLEAKKYLGEETVTEHLDEERIDMKVTSDKTMFNKQALKAEDSKNPNEMSKESFMAEVEKDADRRYKDRLVRTEKMETFKKQATLAFRRAEFEKALVLYTKAIEQIKDSALLYNNRALTYIKLGLYEKAKADLKEWALRINENGLKSWLLLAKIHFLCEEKEEFGKAVVEAKKRNPEEVKFIEQYCNDLTASDDNGEL